MDSITQYEAEIEAHNKEIERQYERFLENPKYSHVAFVTFRTIAGAASKSQIVIDRNINGLRSHPAPQQVCDPAI